jgi:hypothetical protein
MNATSPEGTTSATNVTPPSGMGRIAFEEPNGTLAFTVTPPGGYGVVRVTGGPTNTSFGRTYIGGIRTLITLTVRFGAIENVSFFENVSAPGWPGLAPGKHWSVILTPSAKGENPAVLSHATAGRYINFTAPCGTTYRFQVTKPSTYRVSSGRGTLSVPDRSLLTRVVKFRPYTALITFRGAGLDLGSTWYVNITGPMNLSLNGMNRLLRAELVNGTYNFTVAEVPAQSFTVNSTEFNVTVPRGYTIFVIFDPAPERLTPGMVDPSAWGPTAAIRSAAPRPVPS